MNGIFANEGSARCGAALKLSTLMVSVVFLCGGCADGDTVAAFDPLGASCLIDADCPEGFACVMLNPGYICTQPCSEEDVCPPGSQCIGTVDGDFCDPSVSFDDEDVVEDEPDEEETNNDEENNDEENNASETCQSDDGCEGGRICVEGSCEEGCRLDAQCPEGEVCDPSSFECVERGQCADDDSEPNNNTATATGLEVGSAVAGQRLCPGDEDFFEFELEGLFDIDLQVNIEGNIDGDDVRVELLDAQGHLMQVQVGTQSVEMSRSRVQAGTYFLHIVPPAVGRAMAYSIQLTAEEQQEVCLDDSQEPNDGPFNSGWIEVGTADMTICPGNEDWFSVFSMGEGSVSFSLRSADTPLEDIQLILYDFEGSRVLDTGTPQGDAIVIERQVSFEDFIIFVAAPGVTSIVSYSITIESDTQGGGFFGDCEDQFEPNDTVPDATMDLQGEFFDSLGLCADEEYDHYAFVMEPDETLNVMFNVFDALGNPSVEILDTDGRTPLETGLLDFGFAELSFSPSSTGVYFLRVGHNLGEDLIYELGLDLQGPPVLPFCDDDLNEPNNAANEAYFIREFISDGVVCPGEDDYFKFRVDSPGISYDITSYNGSPVFGSIAIELFDQDGVTSLGSAQERGDETRLSHTFDEAGIYFFKISLSEGENSSYMVEVMEGFFDDLEQCHDEMEPNDSMDLAREVGRETYRDLRLCGQDFEDFYAIALGNAERLQVSIEFDAMIGDVDLYVYDENFEVIAESVGFDSPESVDFQAPSAGTYYIVPNYFGNFELSYSMDIR